jgi:hypothetical protein
MRDFLQPEFQLPPGQIDSLDSHDQLIPQSELIPRAVTLERVRFSIVSVTIRWQTTYRHHSIDRNLDRTHDESILLNPPDDPSEHLANSLLEKM